MATIRMIGPHGLSLGNINCYIGKAMFGYCFVGDSAATVAMFGMAQYKQKYASSHTCRRGRT